MLDGWGGSWAEASTRKYLVARYKVQENKKSDWLFYLIAVVNVASSPVSHISRLVIRC